MMNGLVVIQNGQFYSIYTPQGIQIAQVFMGADGQIIQDVLALKEITQALKNAGMFKNVKTSQAVKA